MNAELMVNDLEAALLERAKSLAEESLARGRQHRDRVIQEENERLRLREEREVLAAKAMAERLYRRKVQSSELHLQEQLDQLRWRLTESVMHGLLERLHALVKDEQSYLPVVKILLATAASAIDQRELVAELNDLDLKRFKDHWAEIAREAAPDKSIILHSDPCTCSGGVRVRDKDNRELVDNTFEGRIERFIEELHRVVIERLFAQAVNIGGVAHG